MYSVLLAVAIATPAIVVTAIVSYSRGFADGFGVGVADVVLDNGLDLDGKPLNDDTDNGR